MDDRLKSTWWALKIAFGVVPIVAGVDKFFNVLANWADYLSPLALQYVPIDAETFMRSVGIVEVIAGLLVLSPWTKAGAYVVATWLVGIAVNLLTTGKYLDVAVRDLVMAVGAFALARLSAVSAEAVEGVAETDNRVGSTTFSMGSL
jgi:uncharacterized membrane protein YphA (DoxX/SURF4 family)